MLVRLSYGSNAESLLRVAALGGINMNAAQTV